MTQINVQRNVTALFKRFLNRQAYIVEFRRNAGWKRRTLAYEAKKDIVFQYAGAKAHRADRIYVWGCCATGALGKILSCLVLVVNFIVVTFCYLFVTGNFVCCWFYAGLSIFRSTIVRTNSLILNCSCRSESVVCNGLA